MSLKYINNNGEEVVIAGRGLSGKDGLDGNDNVPAGIILQYEGEEIPEGFEEIENPNEEVEIITNSNGTAVKYPDGRMECSYLMNLGTGLAVTKVYGSVYITNNTFTWTFPVAFKQIPTDIQVTGMLPGGIGGASYAGEASTTACGPVYMWHAQSYTFTNRSLIYFKAVGYWK